MDTQEPGAQSESDVHRNQALNADAAAQGPSPDKAASPDKSVLPDEHKQTTQEPPTQKAGDSLSEEINLIQ